MTRPGTKNIFRSEKAICNDKGIILCPNCNGSGLNDEYFLFNKLEEFLESSIRAYCLECFGQAQTDWVEFTNGRIDDIMKELIEKHGKYILYWDIVKYLRFIYHGEIYQDEGHRLFRYNREEDKWEEIYQYCWKGHLLGKKDMLYWLDKFIEDGYIKRKNINLPMGFIAIFESDANYDCAAVLKAELLEKSDITIDELLQFKDNLSVLGYTIDDLNWIDTDGIEGIKTDFTFTWENLLDKFGLPYTHENTPIGKGILLF